MRNLWKCEICGKENENPTLIMQCEKKHEKDAKELEGILINANKNVQPSIIREGSNFRVFVMSDKTQIPLVDRTVSVELLNSIYVRVLIKTITMMEDFIDGRSILANISRGDSMFLEEITRFLGCTREMTINVSLNVNKQKEEMGSITDKELDEYKITNPKERENVKEQYSTHSKGFF